MYHGNKKEKKIVKKLMLTSAWSKAILNDTRTCENGIRHERRDEAHSLAVMSEWTQVGEIAGADGEAADVLRRRFHSVVLLGKSVKRIE